MRPFIFSSTLYIESGVSGGVNTFRATAIILPFRNYLISIHRYPRDDCSPLENVSLINVSTGTKYDTLLEKVKGSKKIPIFFSELVVLRSFVKNSRISEK